MMRKLATLLLGCAVAMGGNNGYGAEKEKTAPIIERPKVPQITFPSARYCGAAKHASLATGGGAVLGTAGGAWLGAGKGATIGAKIGLSCDATTGGSTLGLCTIAGVSIGSVVGGVIGAVGGGVGVNMAWDATFGHHNCAAAIYTYRGKDGNKWFRWSYNSESIGRARSSALRRIRRSGGSNAKELVTFDLWEERCAAFTFGEDGDPYSGLGPSDTRARLALKATCKQAGTKCDDPSSFCNSWAFFDWGNWSW